MAIDYLNLFVDFFFPPPVKIQSSDDLKSVVYYNRYAYSIRLQPEPLPPGTD